MNCDITEYETPKETLIREAIEYLELYYHERYDEMKGTTGFMPKEERINSVRNSIETSGTYAHTFDELQHGARVAWRNAPKCSNRKYWQNLKLLDCRDVTSNKGIYDCCLDHLSKAMSCGSSEAYISVFRQAAQGTSDGPRIWNDQLLQYAAYMDDDGNVMGDPKNVSEVLHHILLLLLLGTLSSHICSSYNHSVEIYSNASGKIWLEGP